MAAGGGEAGGRRARTPADRGRPAGGARRPVEYTAAWLWIRTGAQGEIATELHLEFAHRVRTWISCPARRRPALLLGELVREGVPTALVTASPRAVADTVLAALGAEHFAVSVTADEIPPTKPAPDPYLAACRALGVHPAACVAVEDTENRGVASAEAAGCAGLAGALARAQPLRTRTNRPTSLEEVTPARLRAMVRAPRAAGDELEPLVRRDEGRRPPREAAQGHRRDGRGRGRPPGERHLGTGTRRGPRAWHHHRAGENLGVISRYPIIARHGYLDVGSQPAALECASGWTAARRWTSGAPTSDDTPGTATQACFDGLPAAELIADEGVRLEQMRRSCARIAESAAEGVPVVLVGDFNAPSHRTRRTVQWPVTRAAEEAGLSDSYREAHPDPVREPGHTWSPVHVEHEDGSGRPEPQDRIDFVLHRGLTVLDSRALVTGTPRPWPEVAGNDWPSDHAAVVTTLRRLNRAAVQKPLRCGRAIT